MHIVDRRSEALMLSRSQAGWIRAAREIYRVMLLAYPRTFRQAYGREMLLVFEDRARDLVRNRGSWALLCFAAGIVWDWLKTIVRETSVDTSNPAICGRVKTGHCGRRPRLVSSTSSPPPSASRSAVSSASCAVRT